MLKNMKIGLSVVLCGLVSGHLSAMEQMTPNTEEPSVDTLQFHTQSVLLREKADENSEGERRKQRIKELKSKIEGLWQECGRLAAKLAENQYCADEENSCSAEKLNKLMIEFRPDDPKSADPGKRQRVIQYINEIEYRTIQVNKLRQDIKEKIEVNKEAIHDLENQLSMLEEG